LTYSYRMSESFQLPLFPLTTVLLPGMNLPLHIFEARYRQLIGDLLKLPEADRKFGVVAIKAGWEVGSDNLPVLHQVGTIAKVRRIKHLPDGKFDISTAGADRFEIKEVSSILAPYLVAKVELLDPVASAAGANLIAAAGEAYANYLKVIGESTVSVYAQLPSEAPALANLLIATLTGNTLEQQRLLEMNSAEEKLKKLITIFNRESILLQTVPSIPAPYLTGVSLSLN
jgi:Lon protease-like protein